MTSISRRSFMATAAAGAAGASLAAGGRLEAAEFKTTIKKSLIVGGINEKTLMQHKEAGFDGVETSAANVEPAVAEQGRAIAEKCGMKIHSVLRGWLSFNDPAKIDAGVKSVEMALLAAKGYGAGAVLMVPCRIGGKKIPQPWEFDFEFDKKTGMISRVVKGDNAPYQQYIEDHNQATKASLEGLKRLISAAEKAQVVVAVENVWNNLWVQPKLAASLIRIVDSPWIQYYFDIGNHVKYAKPEEWIREFGKLIVELHVKDFKLNPDGHGGNWADIRDGSVDWPLVRRELDKVGYNGWMTIEGSGKLSLEEKSKRLDLIIAGK